MISEEERMKYVEDDGVHCPFCKGQEFNYGEIKGDGGYYTQDVTCCHCSKKWTDVCTLELCSIEFEEDRSGLPG